MCVPQIDSLEHTSDSAEEVCWTPAQPRASRPHTIPFSPMVASVGLECAAAVNLLSMSIRDSDLRNVAQLPLAPLCLAGTQACAQESSPEDSQALQAAPKVCTQSLLSLCLQPWSNQAILKSPRLRQLSWQ